MENTSKGLCFQDEHMLLTIFENIKTLLRLIRILKNKNMLVFVRFHKTSKH